MFEGWGLIQNVGRFTSLTHLELKNLCLSRVYENLRPLAALTQLESLVLRDNSYLVRDLRPLETLTRLTNLTLGGNGYDPWDTSPLEDPLRAPG